MDEQDYGATADHPALAAEDVDYQGMQTKHGTEKGSIDGGGANPGDLAAIKKFMSIDSIVDYKDEGDLRQIMEFAHKEGVETDGDLAMWLKKLQIKLGTPEMGQSRVKQILHYLDIDHRVEELLKEQRGFTSY